MSTNNNFNISNIETFMYGILHGVLSRNVYVGSLPDTIQDSWNDMCYIDCSNVISDENACAKGSVLIWLYARPLSNGTKNVMKMSELEVELNRIIDEQRSGNYRITRTNTYTDYDSNRQWHCNIVELNIIIS